MPNEQIQRITRRARIECAMCDIRAIVRYEAAIAKFGNAAPLTSEWAGNALGTLGSLLLSEAEEAQIGGAA